MPGRLARALLLVLAASAALALAACGGGDDSDEAADILNKAFSNEIGSANVNLQIELKVDGVDQLSDPIKVQLNGPYKSNGQDKVPAFDWDISGSLGGQSGAFKVISTGENAFVNFQGTDYEVGEEVIAQANEQASQGEGESRSFADLGLNPRDWIEDEEVEGDADVAGVETDHVSGTFNTEQFLRDLNEAASRAGGDFGGATPAQLPDEQIEQFTNAVKNPRFDVYVGKDDERLHRLSADLEFEVPEEDRASVGGATGGSLSLNIEFSEIGQEVSIEAPENARPIEDLTDQLEGLGGGLGGLGGGSTDQGDSGGGSIPTPPGGGGEAPGAEAFEEYGQCLEEADPGDTEAIQDCADLLR